MSNIRLERIQKSFGDFQAVKDFDLEIGEGEFVTLLGGSGSGKTTCLRLVAGFVQPDAGRIFIGGQDVTDVPAHRRDTGMVFQSYALFPHMTAAQNIAYGLKIRRLPRAEVEQRTREALALIQLSQLADRYPHQLSGGQRQRVALARAVVIRPKVMLLDEPLGALDLKLRQELQVEIKRVQQSVGITTIFVTHDQTEALSLSDRVIVMRDGRILQAASPNRLYCNPVNRYVADFVGRMNFLEVTVAEASGDRYRVALQDGSTIDVAGRQVRAFGIGERCLVGVRPEDLALTENAGNRLPVQVLRSTYSGNVWTITCSGGGNGDVQAVAHARSSVPDANTTAILSWPPDRCVLLDHE
jgi:putative spermidine/putrescine transport system ATP-binding protein